jgi:hypothetical protein
MSVATIYRLRILRLVYIVYERVFYLDFIKKEANASVLEECIDRRSKSLSRVYYKFDILLLDR